MAERALSERALNRALLARQMLLERRGGRLADAVDRLGGLQTQYAPSGYIGLWSRLDGFARADLTRALERRAIVQGTIMRATIHMVSAADYPLLVAGVRDARRDWWLKAHRNRIEAATVAEAAARARALLADGPLRRTELVRRLGVTSDLWNGIGLWVDLLRAPPPGTWEQRRADLYVAAGDWLEPTEPGRDAGIEHLVRRYLTGFGPASVRDIASCRAAARRRQARRRAGRAAPLPRRGGRHAGRPPPRPHPGRGHAGAGPVPGHMGRDAARPRTSHGRPARAVPADPLQHEDAPVAADVPRRRPGRGQLALRGRAGRDDGVRAAARGAEREVAAEAERLAAFMA